MVLVMVMVKVVGLFLDRMVNLYILLFNVVVIITSLFDLFKHKYPVLQKF